MAEIDEKLVERDQENSDGISVPRYELVGKLDELWEEQESVDEVNKIKICNSSKSGGGRSVKATEDIAIGEIVVCQPSFTNCLVRTHYNGRCYNCLKVIRSPWPCSTCRYVSFCSAKCKDDSWKNSHKVECEYSCGIVGCLGLNVLLKAISENSVTWTDCTVFSESDTDLEAFMKFHGNPPSKESDFKQGVLLSVATTILLLQEKVISEEDKFEISKLLLDINYKISTNSYGARKMIDPKADDPNKAFEYFGKSLFPGMISMINHSCHNNCVPILAETEQRGVVNYIIATREILEGDEITINYGNEVCGSDVAGRKAFLAEQYNFECVCKACLKGWPGKLPETSDNEKFESYKDLAFEMFYAGAYEEAFMMAKSCLELISWKGLESKDTFHFQEKFVYIMEMYFKSKQSVFQ